MKTIERCRFCNSDKLKKYLDLGEIPLVNNLLNSEYQPHRLYPLQVFLCENCTMSQLNVVIPPEILYNHYRYQSCMSNTFLDHCKDLATGIQKLTDGFVVSIAENDGPLLCNFPDKNNVLAVEPATNLCSILAKKEIPFVNKFFNYDTALEILTTCGRADVIVAQNVFAHVDEITRFMAGVDCLLKKNGLLIIEVPWVGSMVNNNLFTQVYHEHLSYISIEGMKQFVHKFELHLHDTEWFPNIHGGTIRFQIKKSPRSVYYLGSVGHDNHLDYSKIQGKVDTIKKDLLQIVKKYPKISAVGAAAKGCILVNTLGLAPHIDKIYDNSPFKINKWQPGSRLPIVDFEEIKDCKNPILILPDNLKDEIIKNVRERNPEAKFIVALPEPQEI